MLHTVHVGVVSYGWFNVFLIMIPSFLDSMSFLWRGRWRRGREREREKREGEGDGEEGGRGTHLKTN